MFNIYNYHYIQFQSIGSRLGLQKGYNFTENDIQFQSIHRDVSFKKWGLYLQFLRNLEK
jgi:hypothetical protein